MSNPIFLDDEQLERTRQASEWFARISTDDVSDADLSAWLAWYAVAQNAREFERMREVWNGMGRLREPTLALLGEVGRDGLVDSAPATGLTRRLRYFFFHTAWRRVAVAVSVAVVLLTGIYLGRQAGWWASDHRMVATATTNQSTTLSDGSTLMLAPRTRVAVDFSGPMRSLALSEGEAYFKVRPNKARPFVVRAGGLTVTAVGTAFDVRSEPQRIVVTVQEGVVSVAGIGGNAPLRGAWRVSAGYQVAFDARSSDVKLTAVNTDQMLDWRSGRLQYFDEPLGNVVRDVNRYAARQIYVSDPRLAQLEFTGTVFVDSIDDWLHSLPASFPVRVVMAHDDRVDLISEP